MKRITQKISRPTLIAAATVCALLSPFASAEARDRGTERYTTYGKVLRAEPIYREVVVRVPTEHCWIEEERYEVQEGYSNSHHNTYRGSRSRSNGRSHSGSTGDTIAGTVIGGVIGNQLGRNGSRGARAGATIAGAIIGSVIANEVTGGQHNSGNSHRRHRSYNNNSHHYNNGRHTPSRDTTYNSRPVERCETVIKKSVKKKIGGYNVTYLHRGRRFTTRTRKNPGSRIALTAQISPARGQ